MLFEELIAKVPDYKSFYTVDEFNERSLALAQKYPDKVKIHMGGYSRKNEPIYILEIGKGSKNALLFGCPHPNEPIGAMMLDSLSEMLAKGEESLDKLDYTWYIIKVIDVDGTKLNEGWFKDSSSIKKYAQHFYRPPGHEQVEWTFPIHYKTLNFDAPLPETKILMKLMEEKKPAFMYSLHNSGFGGVYYYVSGDLGSQLFDDFQALPGKFDLPLNLGEPEAPYLKQLAPAIFQLFGISEEYEYLVKHLPQGTDPAKVIKAGTSSDDYASQVGNTYSLVCEMPYYYDSRVDDKTELAQTRQEFLKKSLESTKQAYDHVKKILSMIESELKDKSVAFYSAVSNYVEVTQDHIKATENWIENDETLRRPATVAEEFDNVYARKFYDSLMQGMLRRLINENLKHDPENHVLLQAKQEADKRFEELNHFLEENLKYKTIPIKSLVCVQMIAGLNTMYRLQEKGEK
ncbi:MAG TPA: M14 family zinc carboxypeptidase [Petrotogaceae bacterium]|nr:M14 family zinc carboxypeptidase [Petrotogaceae bacterium]